MSKSGCLLLHGFSGSPLEMIPLAEVLEAEGWIVSNPPLAGHMTSPRELARTSWPQWVQSARDAYEDLSRQCDRVAILGLDDAQHCVFRRGGEARKRGGNLNLQDERPAVRKRPNLRAQRGGEVGVLAVRPQPPHEVAELIARPDHLPLLGEDLDGTIGGLAHQAAGQFEARPQGDEEMLNAIVDLPGELSLIVLPLRGRVHRWSRCG